MRDFILLASLMLFSFELAGQSAISRKLNLNSLNFGISPMNYGRVDNWLRTSNTSGANKLPTSIGTKIVGGTTRFILGGEISVIFSGSPKLKDIDLSFFAGKVISQGRNHIMGMIGFGGSATEIKLSGNQPAALAGYNIVNGALHTNSFFLNPTFTYFRSIGDNNFTIGIEVGCKIDPLRRSWQYGVYGEKIVNAPDVPLGSALVCAINCPNRQNTVASQATRIRNEGMKFRFESEYKNYGFWNWL